MAISKFSVKLTEDPNENVWGKGEEPRLLQSRTAVIQASNNPYFRDILNLLKEKGFKEEKSLVFNFEQKRL